jgi:diguanylate cyclase (GGDEF)-like protein
MSEVSLVKDEHDALWTRIRAAVEAMRPGGRQDREPAYGRAAIARSLGMRTPLGERIEDVLEEAWAHCAERRVTLSLLLVGIDRFKDLHLIYERGTIERELKAVETVLRRGLPRAGDACLRHGRSSFLIVLPDYPVLLAKALAGKLMDEVRGLAIPHKESHAGILTAGVGLVAVNPHGSRDRKLFDAAADALARAQRYGLGRIETVDLRPGQRRKAG